MSHNCLLFLDDSYLQNERGDIEVTWNLQLLSEVFNNSKIVFFKIFN